MCNVPPKFNQVCRLCLTLVNKHDVATLQIFDFDTTSPPPTSATSTATATTSTATPTVTATYTTITSAPTTTTTAAAAAAINIGSDNNAAQPNRSLCNLKISSSSNNNNNEQKLTHCKCVVQPCSCDKAITEMDVNVNMMLGPRGEKEQEEQSGELAAALKRRTAAPHVSACVTHVDTQILGQKATTTATAAATTTAQSTSASASSWLSSKTIKTLTKSNVDVLSQQNEHIGKEEEHLHDKLLANNDKDMNDRHDDDGDAANDNDDADDNDVMLDNKANFNQSNAIVAAAAIEGAAAKPTAFNIEHGDDSSSNITVQILNCLSIKVKVTVVFVFLVLCCHKSFSARNKQAGHRSHSRSSSRSSRNNYEIQI